MVWIALVVFACILLYSLASLITIAFKKQLLSHVEATVERVSLTERPVPNAKQVYLVVTYRIAGGHTDQLNILFWTQSRERIERSSKYRKLIHFYAPGRTFRIYNSLLTGPIPESPTVMVGTGMAILLACVSALVCASTIFALTL